MLSACRILCGFTMSMHAADCPTGEILCRYIWPKYRICEKTCNIIKRGADPRVTERIARAERQLTLFG